MICLGLILFRPALGFLISSPVQSSKEKGAIPLAGDVGLEGNLGSLHFESKKLGSLKQE